LAKGERQQIEPGQHEQPRLLAVSQPTSTCEQKVSRNADDGQTITRIKNRHGNSKNIPLLAVSP
jgi:hypothetical protein